jgi:hypothetical protein
MSNIPLTPQNLAAAMAAALNASSRPLSLYTEHFHGLPDEDFQGWLFSLEMQLRAASLSDESKIAFTIQCLKGEARAWVQNDIRNAEANIPGYTRITTWGDLRSKLVNRFEPQHADLRNRLALFQIRQTGSLAEYIRQFFTITSRLSDMPEKQKVAAFINGYKTGGPAYNELVRQDPDTVAQAVAIAQQYEAIPAFQDHVTPMEMDRIDNPQQVRCNTCGGINHYSRYCLANRREHRFSSRQQPQRNFQQNPRYQQNNNPFRRGQQRRSNNPFRRQQFMAEDGGSQVEKTNEFNQGNAGSQ